MLIRRGALREIWESAGDAGRAPLVASDGWDAAATAAILAEADRLHGQPWPQPLLSQWSDYARSGNRSVYEAAVFTRNRRIRIAVLAAAIDPTEARVREAADGLWLKCEQSTWCWPAHDDAFARGLMVPERPFVDLGAGEDAALAAWSALLIGDQLDAVSPGLRERLAAETRQRVLHPFVDRRDWHWEGTEQHVHNWAPWIHSNLLPATIAFAEPELRDRVFALAVDGLDRYLAQLPADGAIDEGFAYWWQGAARAFDALALLDPLTGGAIARAVADGELAGLGELVRFPQRMQLGRDWFASFSDASARRDDQPWHVLFRAARLCGASDAAGFAAGLGADAAMCGLDDGVAAGLGRMIAELSDAGWRRSVAAELPLPERVWLPSIGVGLRRERAGSEEGLAVLVKGGSNGENHNHNDLGSFTVAVDGVPLLPDLGRAEYTAATFSDARYELWNVRSGWHSAPAPHGVEQCEGREWTAPVVEEPDGWRIDLSRAYPGLRAEWTRTIRVDAGAVGILDESAALADPDTRIIVVCVGVPVATGAGVRVPGREGSRDLLLTHDSADVVIETVDVDDPYLRASWGERVSRIRFAPLAGIRWEMRAQIVDPSQ